MKRISLYLCVLPLVAGTLAMAQAPVRPVSGNTGSAAGVSGGAGLGDTPSTAPTGTTAGAVTRPAPTNTVPVPGNAPAGNTGSAAGLSGGPGLGDTPSTAPRAGVPVGVPSSPGTATSGTLPPGVQGTVGVEVHRSAAGTTTTPPAPPIVIPAPTTPAGLDK